MPTLNSIARVVDLLDPNKNVLYDVSVDDARAVVAGGDADAIGRIGGQFALVGRDGTTVRMARTIGRIMRYFIAKRAAGPALIVSDRIDAIQRWLDAAGLGDQFHPSYTRMVPAHHLVEIRLVGCPDPNPAYARFFRPPPPHSGELPADLDVIGKRYVQAVQAEMVRWLGSIPPTAPIGVAFSGGIDSGSVFLLAYDAVRRLGMNPSRLKAFTLSVDGGGEDAAQARASLDGLDLGLFLEVVEVPPDAIDTHAAIRVMEDYKPLDVQAGAMVLALCRAIRDRYPDWKHLLDGDGGDENLKDYPIEENPELTIRSVLNNPMLYQEGWGVESIKHSLTYSGGQSRGYVRTYAPASATGFDAFSPYTSPSVIAVAEAIPFAVLTGWNHDRLYELKGEIVSRGVRAVTGMEMPVYAKRRFQHGVMSASRAGDPFPARADDYRRMFNEIYA